MHLSSDFLRFFSEEATQFYVTESALAIESIHLMGFIHRYFIFYYQNSTLTWGEVSFSDRKHSSYQRGCVTKGVGGG